MKVTQVVCRIWRCMAACDTSLLERSHCRLRITAQTAKAVGKLNPNASPLWSRYLQAAERDQRQQVNDGHLAAKSSITLLDQRAARGGLDLIRLDERF